MAKSCIHHEPGMFVAIAPSYIDIAGDVTSSVIIGLFHQWWCNGYPCTATASQITSSLLGIAAEKAVRGRCKSLCAAGLLEKVDLTPEQVKGIVLQMRPSFPALSYQRFERCQWCGCEASVFHHHHYPVQKSDGGEYTVKICANCHCEFHAIAEANVYRPSPETFSVFQAIPHYSELSGGQL